MDAGLHVEAIEQLSLRRQEIWASADPSPAEVARIGKRLANAFEDKRATMAQFRPAQRKKIERNASVARELASLIARA
jgi:hypothetical protein